MKTKLVFLTVVIVFVFFVIYLNFSNVRQIGQKYHQHDHEHGHDHVHDADERKYHQPVPHDTQKINQHGAYQPFYGYTIAAMVDPSLKLIGERVAKFLRESKLSVTYSALPASTYHMTIFSIYQCGNRMIPPVERWVNATGSIVSKHSWLPDEVLQERNEKALCIIDKYLNEPLRINAVNLIANETVIALSLIMEEDSLIKIQRARKEFAKIYEDLDLSMEPIDEMLHITFGYVYTQRDKPYEEEWNRLNDWSKAYSIGQFSLPSVYLFDSMTNYIPYQRSKHIKC